MALPINIAATAGGAYAISIQQLSTGLYYDFSSIGSTSHTFTATPTILIQPLTTQSGNYNGLYTYALSTTPQAVWINGEYAVFIHDQNASNTVRMVITATMYNGDSAPVFLSGAGVDPWSVPLPGSYSAGTAGAILGTNLDVNVSSRSTYAGGPVASVTNPVTIGTNNDKTGYALSSAGLDAITVETGVNARQALSPILAATAGSLSGAGTGTIVIRGGNVATTRITATTDNAGNRSSVTLSLPT